MLTRLNKLFFIPPLTDFVVNAVVFGFIFVLVIVFGYFSDKLTAITNPIARTDTRLSITLFLLLGGLIVMGVLIYSKTKKHFLCSSQCLSATVGTTLLVMVLYASVWGLIQIAKGNQQFVVFQPWYWSLQVTLNNLKYATLLFVMSSPIALISNLAISQPGYDFKTFLDHWTIWKRLVDKLNDNIPLEDTEHEPLVQSTNGMLSEITTMHGHAHVQPASLDSALRLATHLRKFRKWYDQQTRYALGDLTGLDVAIQSDVREIRRLC